MYCDIISGLKREHKCTGKSVEVDDNGKAQIHLSTHDEDGILAIHIQVNSFAYLSSSIFQSSMVLKLGDKMLSRFLEMATESFINFVHFN